jgi:hypothetical protein
MTRRPRDDRGAALILALVFVFAIGVVLAGIASFATGSATNTSNLRQLRTSATIAENLTSQAIGQMRADPTRCKAAPGDILPGMPQVFCVQTGDPRTIQSRIDDIYTCPNATAANPCSQTGNGMFLHATVIYNDISSNSPTSPQCTPTIQATCGVQVSIDAWDVRTSDS